MALVNCPECGRANVSDSARSCPGCGFDVMAYYERKRDEDTSPVMKELRAFAKWYTDDEDDEEDDEEDDYDAYFVDDWDEEDVPLHGVALMRHNIRAFCSAVREMFFRLSTQQLTEKAVKRLPKRAEGNLLLLGFGYGSGVEALMKRTSCRVYGLDASTENLRRARKWNLTYLRGGRLNLRAGHLTAQSFEPDTFRYVIASNTCYQWKIHSQGFRQLHRVMEAEGTLFLSFVDPEDASRWTGRNYLLTEDDLISAAQQEGFRLESSKYFPIIPGKLLVFRAAEKEDAPHD